MSDPESPIQISDELRESLREMQDRSGPDAPDALIRAIKVLDFLEQDEEDKKG